MAIGPKQPFGERIEELELMVVVLWMRLGAPEPKPHVLDVVSDADMKVYVWEALYADDAIPPA